jgi:hypothetical protein
MKIQIFGGVPVLMGVIALSPAFGRAAKERTVKEGPRLQESERD